MAIVSALPYEEHYNFESGYVYVFEKDSTDNWHERATLTPFNTTGIDYFGFSVSVSASIAVVGASRDSHRDSYGYPSQNSGSVYVFERDDSTGVWSETAKLTASDRSADDYFGESVSVFGNFVIVGAYNNNDSGSAYVFQKNDSTDEWNEITKLTASDGEADDNFGRSVSISGNIAIVGAYHDDNENGDYAGSAYVFERDDSSGIWKETAKLMGSDGRLYQGFGSSVSISGNIAVIGAQADLYTFASAYVFEKNHSSGYWNETAILKASDEAIGDYFGFSVSISGNIAVVGAPGDDYENYSAFGAAYVFERDASTGYWSEVAKIPVCDGNSVSVSGNTTMLGFRGDYNDNGSASGSVYVFERL